MGVLFFKNSRCETHPSSVVGENSGNNNRPDRYFCLERCNFNGRCLGTGKSVRVGSLSIISSKVSL